MAERVVMTNDKDITDDTGRKKMLDIILLEKGF